MCIFYAALLLRVKQILKTDMHFFVRLLQKDIDKIHNVYSVSELQEHVLVLKSVPVLTAVLYIASYKKVTNEPGFHSEYTFCRTRYLLMTA